MRALISTVLLFTLPALAQTPPDFDPVKWNKVVERAVRYGAPMPVGDGRELHILSNLVPNDKTVTHQADYFSSIGVVDSENRYHPIEISVVSEHWLKRDDGLWQIEQYIFGSSLKGELRTISHQEIVEDVDGRVKSVRSLPVGKPEEELGRWGKKIEEWIEITN